MKLFLFGEEGVIDDCGGEDGEGAEQVLIDSEVSTQHEKIDRGCGGRTA